MTQYLELPWKVQLIVYALTFTIQVTRRTNGTVRRRLSSLFDLRSPPSKEPIKGVTATDITVDRARNLWFRLYTPTPTRNATLPVVFYFHGGGFSFLAADSKPMNDLCYSLANELSALVISVNYRLAPEHRCPAQYEDCFDVVKFIDETEIEGFPRHIANLKQCFLAGDSAGGNIVHHVQVNANEHEFRSIKLIGNVLIQPFFGGQERTEAEMNLEGKVPLVNMERTDWMWKAFLQETESELGRDHPAANVFGPYAADISRIKIPASIVFVGGYDPLKDWQKRYYEGLKKSGKEAYLHEYSNAFHSFYAHPELPEFSWFIRDLKDFVQKQIAAANN